MLTATDSSFSQNPLLAFFLMPTQQDPFAFETELKRQQLKDTQSTEIFEQLVFLIGQRYKKALLDENSDAIKKTGAQLALLKTLLKKPPQSGSSDLFWKMAWLQWCSLNGTL